MKLPSKVLIETTSRCNLKCPHCLYRDRRGSEQFKLWDKLREVTAQATEVYLDGGGELLLNPELPEVFKQLEDSPAKLAFTTNGVYLNESFKHWDIIPWQRISKVTVSIDALDDTTEQLRPGVKKEVLFNNIAHFPWKHLLGLNFVASQDNIRQLPNLIRFAADMGIKDVNIMHKVITEKDDSSSLYHDQVMSDGIMLMAKVMGMEIGINLVMPDLFTEAAGERKLCGESDTFVFIQANGKVQACCDSRMVMGDLNMESFKDIWESAGYTKLRATVNSHICPGPCLNCWNPCFKDVLNKEAHYCLVL